MQRRTTAWALGAALIAGAAVATTPAGAAGPIREFAPFQTPVSYPCEVALDNDGNLWSDQFVGNRMGRVDPRTGDVSEVALPNPGGQPGGQNRGPDGDIWFVEVGGNALGRLHPQTRSISTYPFPWLSLGFNHLTALTPINAGPGVPFDNSFGKDGKLYFTLVGLNAIGSYDIATGAWDKFAIPTPLAGPIAMEKGPGNTIAITEGTGNKIGVFDIYTHAWTEYAIPTPASLPGGLTVSPDDRYIYFGETLGNKIGRVDTVTGTIREWDLLALRGGLPTNVGTGNPLPNPGQMRFGSDGKLYFMQGTFTFGSQVGQLDVATSEYNELNTPTPFSSPCDLNNTVPGKLYFGEFTGNRLAWIDIPITTDISNTFPVYG